LADHVRYFQRDVSGEYPAEPLNSGSFDFDHDSHGLVGSMLLVDMKSSKAQ
jgi:hypothetical protein